MLLSFLGSLGHWSYLHCMVVLGVKKSSQIGNCIVKFEFQIPYILVGKMRTAGVPPNSLRRDGVSSVPCMTTLFILR